MEKGLSQKSVVEILDYLLFLVGNYDYLQSRIISLGKEKVGRPGCFKQLLALPPLLQVLNSVSYQFSNTSISFISLFYFLFEGKNPLQNIFFFPSYNFTKIFPMASMSNQGASLLSSSFQCWFCSFVSLNQKKKKFVHMNHCRSLRAFIF